MNKIRQILLGIFLLIIPVFASANSISDSELNSQTSAGNILSDSFSSLSLCTTTKDKYNNEFSSYKRSDCFSYNGDFYYFICQSNNTCSINVNTNSSTTTNNNTNIQANNTNVPNKAKLDAAIKKIAAMEKEFNNHAKYIAFLEAFEKELKKLGTKYAGNDTIKQMIGYLGVETQKLKSISSMNSKNNDIDNFFCDLLKNCDDVNTNNTDTNNTNSSVNTSINNTNQSMNDINKKDECKKMQLFGNISICDTGKKGTYQDMNNLCPAGYHVPNYWEMDYIIKSGVVLDFTESSYYINSLYSDIVKVDSYPFAKYPFLLKRFNNQYTMNHTSDLTWLNNLSKENILCINNDANTPKIDTNGTNWTSCGVNFDNLIGKYNLSRKYLIRDEKIIIESLSNQLLKGNIDYVVQLECSDKGLLKKESIKKVNSCNYGYKLQNNDCIVDPLICNLENFGNTHPTNGMICSWKNLGEEKKDYGFFRYGLLKLNKQSVGYSSELDIRLNGENNEMKKNMLKKYQTQYNNKVDIDINCQLSENKDGIRDHRDFNVFTSCKINGLFWQ